MARRERGGETKARWLSRLMMGGFLLFAGAAPPALAQQSQPGNVATKDASHEDSASREIQIKRFTEARRPAVTQPSHTRTSSGRRTGVTTIARARRQVRYRRTTPVMAIHNSAPTKVSSVAMATPSEVGVTIWRLRPSTTSDDRGARMLVMEDAKKKQFTPERIEADTPLRVNDRVRLSIESPRAGYLYVVDREQYADGTMGDPYLIFPTMRTRGGDNEVRPGKLIDIPAQEDDPNYFTLVPSPSREDEVSEILSILVTTMPLENVQITEKPLRLSKSQIQKLEKEWGSLVERYEMEGGAGQTWTAEEREASAVGTGRYLTQGDPSPQTIYLVEGKNNAGLLVTVPLRYRR
jgi:hypothetical protein